VFLRLSYASPLQQAPDLNAIFSEVGRAVYLYQSHIDSIQAHLIGKFVVAVPQANLDLKQFKQQLQAHFANIEVLGYARATH
jgi:D-methionine transport system ATP-binding protein